MPETTPAAPPVDLEAVRQRWVYVTPFTAFIHGPPDITALCAEVAALRATRARVEQQEREACARVCESRSRSLSASGRYDLANEAEKCARAIRVRTAPSALASGAAIPTTASDGEPCEHRALENEPGVGHVCAYCRTLVTPMASRTPTTEDGHDGN